MILIANQYFYGIDILGARDGQRFHTDDSVQVKWFEDTGSFVTRFATTVTFDAGARQVTSTP